LNSKKGETGGEKAAATKGWVLPGLIIDFLRGGAEALLMLEIF